ncbi:hypothetical protein JQX13_04900 [Archangium violaceum]|uniref:hypothetical protein n=1 Tax=Archangium violaceum TaxID=83451 RepID=UPI00193C20C4|nr:hypothetical protein [Archangium violaceum]QRK09480.1 hypothetical protein JQX13_04900 [Archangium violaceum]
MKTRVKVLGAAVLVAVLGGVGCAGTKEAARDVGAAVPGLSQNREGVVTDMDKDAYRIAVKAVDDPSAPEAWFVLTPGTRLERDGQAVTWDDLDEGTPVRVSYEPATGPEKTYKVEILTGDKADEVKRKAEHLGQ